MLSGVFQLGSGGRVHWLHAPSPISPSLPPHAHRTLLQAVREYRAFAEAEAWKDVEEELQAEG